MGSGMSAVRVAAGLMAAWAVLTGCRPPQGSSPLVPVGPTAVQQAPAELSLGKRPDWGMQGADAAHSGMATSVGPEQAERLWSAAVPAAGQAQPAITADGTVYVAGERNGSWHLTAVSPAGQVLWTHHLGLAGPFTPAIGDDGTVYAPVGTPEPGLLAVLPQGAERWRISLHLSLGLPASQPVPAEPGLPLPSPVIHRDGQVLMGAGHALAAVGADGQVAWVWSAGAPGQARVGTPAVGPDGSIYLPVRTAPDQHALVQLSPKGEERWRHPLAGWASTPAVGSDGLAHLAVALPDGGLELAAVRINGQLRWQRRLDWPPSAGGPLWPWGDAMPALAGGRVHLGALSASRNEQFPAALPDGYQVASPAAMDAGSVRYVLARRETRWAVVAVAFDGRLLWEHPIAAPGSYPAVGGGRVYLVEIDGEQSRLLALGSPP